MNSSLLDRIRGSEAMPRNQSECGWCAGRSRALQLRRVPAFTKLLGNNEVFIPLNGDEVAWLNAFAGDERRVVEMSEGIMEGSKVIVLRGPLMGHEAEIKRIDRHRRTAELEIRMLGRVKTIRLGLEIISKSSAKA